MNTFGQIVKLKHNLDLQNPFRVVYHHSATSMPEAQADMHYELQMGIVLTGAMEVAYPDFKTRLAAGQVWWSFCWEPHACRPARANTGQLIITLLVEALGNIDPFAQFSWLAPFSLPPARRPQAATRNMRAKILMLGNQIRKINAERASARQTLLWLKIHELIIILGRDEKSFQPARPAAVNSISRIIPALELVKSGPAKAVAVAQAARACGLSVSRFSEVFPGIMGITFGRFALQTRLAGATKILKMTDQPIKAIAREWGFANASHFHNIFKQHLHCTPAAYRKQAATASGPAGAP